MFSKLIASNKEAVALENRQALASVANINKAIQHTQKMFAEKNQTLIVVHRAWRKYAEENSCNIKTNPFLAQLVSKHHFTFNHLDEQKLKKLKALFKKFHDHLNPIEDIYTFIKKHFELEVLFPKELWFTYPKNMIYQNLTNIFSSVFFHIENIWQHGAQDGISLSRIDPLSDNLEVILFDKGKGIEDILEAIKPHHSIGPGGRHGLGLSYAIHGVNFHNIISRNSIWFKNQPDSVFPTIHYHYGTQIRMIQQLLNF